MNYSEIYDFMAYLSQNRGLATSSRARMLASLKQFYGYLTVKTAQIQNNPVLNIDTPKLPKELPHYLTLEESQKLLAAVDGKNKERDYCILCIFLNCGLRISELVGLNTSDIREDSIVIRGKGHKERTVFLNNAVTMALNSWLAIRDTITTDERHAVFLSSRRKRISADAVQAMLKKTLLKAGLDAARYSPCPPRSVSLTTNIQNTESPTTTYIKLRQKNSLQALVFRHFSKTILKFQLSGF